MAFVNRILLWPHLSRCFHRRSRFRHCPSSPHRCLRLCSQRRSPRPPTVCRRSDPCRCFLRCGFVNAPSSSRLSPDVFHRRRTDLSSARAEVRVSEKSVCSGRTFHTLCSSFVLQSESCLLELFSLLVFSFSSLCGKALHTFCNNLHPDSVSEIFFFCLI